MLFIYKLHMSQSRYSQNNVRRMVGWLTISHYNFPVLQRQTRCPSASERLNRQWPVHHPYHGILLSGRKEWATDSYMNPDNYAKWKSQSPKGHGLYDSIYIAFWKWENYRNGSWINCCQGPGTRPLWVMGGLYQESQDLINSHLVGKFKPIISYWGGSNDCHGRRPQFEQTAVFSQQRKGKQDSSRPLMKWSMER